MQYAHHQCATTYTLHVIRIHSNTTIQAAWKKLLRATCLTWPFVLKSVKEQTFPSYILCFEVKLPSFLIKSAKEQRERFQKVEETANSALDFQQKKFLKFQHLQVRAIELKHILLYYTYVCIEHWTLTLGARVSYKIKPIMFALMRRSALYTIVHTCIKTKAWHVGNIKGGIKLNTTAFYVYRVCEKVLLG